ncbi:hypothetical protein, partial [Alloprevotella tannerae]|uniref:hypothetical protein n=1 Tax=Alloprevotella tannerae TaxID=76122 RepID=UPI0036241D62
CLSIATFFLCVQRSEYADSFYSNIKVAGWDWHKVLAENTTRRCGDFPDKPFGSDLVQSIIPVTTFANKKEQHQS